MEGKGQVSSLDVSFGWRKKGLCEKDIP
jgi:hypothetical protein